MQNLVALLVESKAASDEYAKYRLAGVAVRFEIFADLGAAEFADIFNVV